MILIKNKVGENSKNLNIELSSVLQLSSVLNIFAKLKNGSYLPFIAVYKGSQLIWNLIKSCFGSGSWINSSTWLNDETWKN